MNAVLAVDGGQSGIRMQHSSSARTVEVDGVIRSHDTVEAVVEAIATAWTSGTFPAVDRVVLGLTTAPAEQSDANRLCSLVAATTAAKEVWLADDTVTAHYGALGGQPGVCLVVGTGVACLAIPPSGDARIFDGHGYLLGDEGGAFWIGRQALRVALRDHDRRIRSLLTERAIERFGAIDGLAIRLHEAESPVNEIAQFAREVLTLAQHDPAAAQIIEDAAARLSSTVADAVEVFNGNIVSVALGGRLLEDGSPLRHRVDALLATHELVRTQTAVGSPLAGALQLGASGPPDRYINLIHVWKAEETA